LQHVRMSAFVAVGESMCAITPRSLPYKPYSPKLPSPKMDFLTVSNRIGPTAFAQ